MRFLIVAVAAILLPSISSSEEQASAKPREDTSTSAYFRALSRLPVPKLEARKTLLRSYQRRGYAAALTDVLNLDGFMALFSFLRTRLQIEYSLSHEPVLVDITASLDSAGEVQMTGLLSRRKFMVRLPSAPREHTYTNINLDWTFPEDPWSRE